LPNKRTRDACARGLLDKVLQHSLAETVCLITAIFLVYKKHMLASAMTLGHIRKEIKNDFPVVMRKSPFVKKKLEQQYAHS